jgi:hypothetical protein
MDPTDNKSWVSGRTMQEALEKAAKSFGVKDLSTISLKQVGMKTSIKMFLSKYI